MGKIVTLGEIMLRLSTPGNTRFVQSDSFDVVYGGGEANVAVSCANYGHDAYFVTKLPKHEIGQSAVNALRKYGVDTRYIARGGDRVGIYYLETGASMRPSKVIYDRAHSAIAEAEPSDFDFDAIMEGADWFHWSGITPAISDKAAELTRLACEAAKRHGVTVSVDLNFRKKLWTKEKAQSIMKPLMKYVDVCIGNEEDAELCLGFKPEADVEGGKTDAEGYKGIFEPDGTTECFDYEKYKERRMLLLMPGVAFDIYGNRMGYGKGFYDRFMKDKEILQTFSIAIGYKCQRVDFIPVEEHDLKPYQVILV